MSNEDFPKPLASTFVLDDDVVLLAEASGDLFLLNPTAGAMWQGLCAGLAPRDIVKTLSSVLKRPRLDVSRDCDALLAEWSKLGLVAGTDLAGRAASSHRESPQWWGAADPVDPPPSRFRPVISRSYRVNDFGFVLRTGGQPADEDIHRFVAHLEAPASRHAKWVLDLFSEDGRWLMHGNGRLIDSSPPDGLMPMLHGNLMLAVYRATRCLLALHAAAVTLDGHCVLLAGIPGAGKSTLTATLLANGFGYRSDDTVLLTDVPVRVRGIPLRVGLKDGSWPVIGPLYPELESLPIHRRVDGKRIRYWLPSSFTSARNVDDTLPASALVFPTYRRNAKTSERRLRRAEALVKLTKAGYDVPSVMTPATLTALADWLGDIECCELVYSDSSEAIAAIRGLLK